MMRTEEEKKEYQRQWWLKNKDRELAKRAAKPKTQEEIERQREYSRLAYERNKAKRAAQVKEWQEANQDKVKAASKRYSETHRDEIKQKRREDYQDLKLAEKTRRATSEMIGPTEAAAILGITLRTFRQWVTDGKIPSTKSPTGRRLIKRADVDALVNSVKAQPKTEGMYTAMQFVKKTTQGGFEVPANFDVIKTYEELTEYTSAFAKGGINFLLLVGSPGSGKSAQMKGELKGTGVTWIDNHVTQLGLYEAVYRAENCPIVLDDVNHFLNNKIACSLVKALTQTDKVRNLSWQSTAKYLEEHHIPKQISTSSPICLIANLWKSTDADYAAIQDRSLPVAFFPTAETIHQRVIDLGWCKDRDIIDFIGERLCDIPQPSMREYYQAGTYKKAGMDWRKKLLAIWGLA